MIFIDLFVFNIIYYYFIIFYAAVVLAATENENVNVQVFPATNRYSAWFVGSIKVTVATTETADPSEIIVYDPLKLSETFNNNNTAALQ